VDDAAGDGAGLARAGAGEDEHGSIEGTDRLALGLVERFEGKGGRHGHAKSSGLTRPWRERSDYAAG